MKRWNNQKHVYGKDQSQKVFYKKRRQKQSGFLHWMLSWLVIFALCLGYGVSIVPSHAQETNFSSAKVSQTMETTQQADHDAEGSSPSAGSFAGGERVLTPREVASSCNADHTISFSMSADPYSSLQTSMSRIGEILVSKNVQLHTASQPEDSSFDVSLSALSSWTNVTGLLSNPVDVVMVLDTSGSMIASYNDSGMTRIEAMKDSVNLFINSLEKSNSEIGENSLKSNLGIITYNDDAKVEIPLTSDIQSLRNCVNALSVQGVTYCNLGLQEGEKMIQESQQDGRSKIVIFFTDGMPSNGYGFTRSIANEAVSAASSIRKSGARIYSIGIFPGADPNVDVALVNGQENTNRFMQAVSSNFPEATQYSEDLGPRASNQYYLSAENPADLEAAFDFIFYTMDGGSGYPTETDPNAPESSGYVTLHDEAGDWMQYDDPILSVNGQEYSPVSQSANGNVVFYRFSGQVPTNAPGVMANLSDIKVTITKGQHGIGDILETQIPAALLPLDVYARTSLPEKENMSDSAQVTYAIPISVQTTASLNISMKDALKGIKNDSSLESVNWLNTHAQSSTAQQISMYSFFSNQWESRRAAWASFTPAAENEFYNAEHSDPTALQTALKENNPTETEKNLTILEKESETDGSSYRLYLGNNGRLDLSLDHSVTISKTVLSQNDYPAPDTVFTYEATLTQPDGTPFTGEIDIENTEHQDDQLSFTNGKASFRLSSTQSIRLKNVPLYSSLQIEEIPVPGFTCSVHTIHGSQTEESDSNSSEVLEFIPGTRASIHFVNTYSLSPLTLTPDQSYLRGEKVLTGRNWQNGDSFTFEVRALSPANAPLPQKANAVVQESDASRAFDFGSVTFDRPGQYIYAIYEKEPEESLPGVSNSLSVYAVQITVTDGGNGTMQVGPPQIIQLRNDQGESVQNAVGSAVFTNAYNAQETQYSPSITKQIAAFPNGSDSEQSGVAAPDAFTFSFTLHALDEDAPMPAGTSNGSVQAANAGSLVQFPAISFDSSHIGKTYHYEISEDPIESLNPAVPGMSASNQKILLDVVVTRALVYGTETVVCTPQYFTQDHQPLTPEQAVLTNHYEYSPAIASIQGEKTLQGRDMAANEFSFTLSGANPETIQAIADKSIQISDPVYSGAAESGSPADFSFENIQFLKPGRYFFQIQEDPTHSPAIEQDASLHYVMAEVALDTRTASLQAHITYLNHADYDANALQFENLYAPQFDEQSAVSLTGGKIVLSSTADSGIEDAIFRFLMTDPKGVQSVLYSPQGAFEILKNQTFHKAGTYVYQLEELPAVSGYPQEALQFDSAKYRIEIDVVDNGQGVLTAQQPRIFRNDQPVDQILFENPISPISAIANTLPFGTKELSGKTLEDNEFQFTWSLKTDVADGVYVDGNLWDCPQEVTNAANGDIDFFGKELRFVKPGHYEISLQENAGGDQNIRYDKTLFTWSYDVSLKEGVLAISVVWPQDPTFHNAYTSSTIEPVRVSVSAKKQLKNGTLKEGAFSFELVHDGNVIQTVTNKKDGSIVFDPLAFDQEGTEELILREKAGKDTSIEYDSSQFKVNVKIEKDSSGKLAAAVTYDKEPVFVNMVKSAAPKPALPPNTGNLTFVWFWILLFTAAGSTILYLRKRVQ